MTPDAPPKRWEPWQALLAAFGAGVAFVLVFIGLIAWVFSFIIHGSAPP